MKIKQSCLSSLLLLALGLILSSNTAHAQILLQSFDNLVNVAQFEGTPPNEGQVDTIRTNNYTNGTTPFAIGGLTDKYLLLNKSNSNQRRFFERSAGINNEAFLRISFDFSVERASPTTTAIDIPKFAGIFIGDTLDHFSQYPESDERWAQLNIYVTDTNSFYLRNETARGEAGITPAYTGEHRVSIFMNNSGSDVMYLGPDDTPGLLSDGLLVVWVDNRIVLSALAYKGESSAINAVKFLLWGNSQTAMARLDDLLITDEIDIYPLPVELLNFNAQLMEDNKNVELRWQTASVLNSSHFVIERSVDGVNFTGIGGKKAAGTTNELQSYRFTDARGGELLSPLIYYRLLQVDYDGASEYSPVIMVEKPVAGFQLVRIHPNPFKDKVSVRIVAEKEQELHFRLLDSRGTLLYQDEQQFSTTGFGDFELDLQALGNIEAGLYLLKVNSGSFNRQYRLLKR